MEILIRINPRVCVGNRVCGHIAPDFFEQGNGGVSRTTRDTWTPADLPLLREAEDNCPSGALTVETEQDQAT
jgi:ferredoxin